jgi:acyl-CoA synthetase (AMP-forming)/AMP-acid ligase II
VTNPQQSEEANAKRFGDGIAATERRALYLNSGQWDDATLAAAVERWAREAPEHVAVIVEGSQLDYTYRRLDEESNRFAAYLRSLGVGAGDVVSVQLPNWCETVAIDVAVLKLGAVLNTLLPIYREHEIDRVLETAKSKVLITPTWYRNFDYSAMVKSLQTRHTFGHVAVPDEPFGDSRITGYLSADLETPLPLAPAYAVSELIFSSGTESRPKAIMHTEQTANAGVRLFTSALGIGAADVVWMPSPIGHSTGFNFGVRLGLTNGLPIALQDKWNPHAAIELINQSHATYTVAATTFLGDVLDAIESGAAQIPSMRLVCSGGAPIPASIVRRAEKRGVTVLRLYGSTEVLVATCNRPNSPTVKRETTDGLPLDEVELQTRDAQGTLTRPGVPGELYVRSPATSVGFLEDPERTAATFSADGWVKTGDIGAVDDSGYFSMVGRSKEIIIRGGLNIAPAEIEELLITMAGVKDVAVVPLPSERLGETACACIVPTDSSQPLTLEDVTTFLRGRGLAAFKLPEAIHLLSELPRTSTGKVQKFEIVNQIRAVKA